MINATFTISSDCKSSHIELPSYSSLLPILLPISNYYHFSLSITELPLFFRDYEALKCCSFSLNSNIFVVLRHQY